MSGGSQDVAGGPLLASKDMVLFAAQTLPQHAVVPPQ